jgi:DNA-binding NtrC family response regulator
MRPLIAVVDDDRDNRALLEIVLSEDYDVQTFCSVREFMSAAGREAFAAVLTDLDLGDGEGGTQLLEYVREKRLNRLIVVAISGHPSDESHSAGRHRFDAHLLKPANIDHVLRTIGSLLQKARPVRAA